MKHLQTMAQWRKGYDMILRAEAKNDVTRVH